MSTEIAPGVADRGVTIVACLAEGRWEQARRDFTAKMSEALDGKRLAGAWARMASLVGPLVMCVLLAVQVGAIKVARTKSGTAG